ncbi:MAG TPA: helix-turn-helix domain-containing protein [Gemmatimonadaceae bacterium]|nr:helix-turn-helix domain-containing protein [Gemmatimonadaceae bacterium]
MTAPFVYFEAEPPEDLAGVVLAFWGFDVRAGATSAHTVWPDASLSLTWGLHEGRTTVLVALGARTEPLTVPVRPGEAYRGIRFRPDAPAMLFGLDARRTRGCRLAPDALGSFGERVVAAARQAPDRSEIIAILADALRPCLPTAGAPDPLVRQAIALLDTAPERTVQSLAHELGVSERQLRRRFGDATGLSPKEYARIRRLRLAVGRVVESEHPRWSELAARAGFADQAHLSNEVARMTAHTPTRLEQRLRMIEHVDVKP